MTTTTSSERTGSFQCEEVFSLTISSELSLHYSSCDRQTHTQTDELGWFILNLKSKVSVSISHLSTIANWAASC